MHKNVHFPLVKEGHMSEEKKKSWITWGGLTKTLLAGGAIAIGIELMCPGTLRDVAENISNFVTGTKSPEEIFKMTLDNHDQARDLTSTALSQLGDGSSEAGKAAASEALKKIADGSAAPGVKEAANAALQKIAEGTDINAAKAAIEKTVDASKLALDTAGKNANITVMPEWMRGTSNAVGGAGNWVSRQVGGAASSIGGGIASGIGKVLLKIGGIALAITGVTHLLSSKSNAHSSEEQETNHRQAKESFALREEIREMQAVMTARMQAAGQNPMQGMPTMGRR